MLRSIVLHVRTSFLVNVLEMPEFSPRRCCDVMFPDVGARFRKLDFSDFSGIFVCILIHTVY